MRKTKRLVGQQTEERYDTNTGKYKVTTVKGVYKNYALEHFTMVRFTDDDKWIKELKPVLPLLLITVLKKLLPGWKRSLTISVIILLLPMQVEITKEL